MPADFPAADARIWTLQQAGTTAKLARQALVVANDAPDTLDLLVRAHRADDAIAVLKRIVDGRPSDIEAALECATTLFADISRDPLRFSKDVIRDVAARAGASLRHLPREDAARAARAVLAFENQFLRRPSEAADALNDFVARWNGTEAALLVELDIISRGPVNRQKLEALEAFARAHPRTAAAARAQYLRGFDLAHNGMALGDRAGADPLERFNAVRAVVGELQSGRYPPCEWVEKAPSLIVEFFAYKPTYTDETRRVMRDAYEQFARAHFTLDHDFPTRSGVGYVVTHKIAELYDGADNGVASVENLLNTWAADGLTGARYLLALYYVDLSRTAKSADAGTRFVAAARNTLEALHDDRDAIYGRQALATLAVFEQQQAAYSAAARYLRDYVAAYPDSLWTWVAALRRGKALEAMGDWPAASRTYLDAASRFESNPVAAVLAAAYAGETYEAMGRFDEALAEYARALAGWDDDYGLTYSLYLTRPVRADEPFATSADDSLVAKVILSDRLTELRRTLSAPGGTLLARARWQFSHAHVEEAIATLSQLLREYPQSRIAPAARSLSHRAQVDRALDTSQIAALTALAAEPYDYWISASKIAQAATRWRDGAVAEAEALMMEALTDWRGHQQAEDRTTPATDLEKDVVAIRNLVFRPKGDGIFAGSRWELNSLSPPETPFFVMNPNMRVKLSTGEVETVAIREPVPEYPRVLFLDADQLAFFDRLLAKVGGTERRQPTDVMEVPNQPVGGAMRLLALLQRFFPARPGHWGGWMFETFPMITAIEFADAARTRAGVHVTVGYEGATLILEKKDGRWVFREMTGRWIT